MAQRINLAKFHRDANPPTTTFAEYAATLINWKESPARVDLREVCEGMKFVMKEKLLQEEKAAWEVEVSSHT